MSARGKTAQPPEPAPALRAEADMSPRLFLLLGLLIVLAAAFIRSLWLGRPSYWIDEINIIRDAMNPPTMADIYRIELERFQSYRGVPFPLFVLRLFLKMLGFAGPYPGPLPPEWAPRLLSLLAGLAALPVFGALGRQLAGRRAGLWAMFLCAVSVFHAWYCRDVRVYSLMATLLAGTLWTGLRLLRTPAPSRKWFLWAAAYVAFAAAYLQSSLNTIFFLAPWSALLLLASVVQHSPAKWFADGRRVISWLIALALPFILFLPFLLRLLDYNIQGQVDDKVVILAWSVIPCLLGRMGWGEAWFTLLPFTAMLVWGVTASVALAKNRREAAPLLPAIQGLAVFALQSTAQLLSNSAFEVRYYMGLFPIFLLLSALGLDRLTSLAIWRKIGGAKVARAMAACLVAAWMLPNLWQVAQVRCQGFCNYKAIADWINTNLPAGGMYSFYNIYEERGVPMTYQTPGRTHTSVAFWSGAQQYFQVQPARRAVDFFRMLPETPFIEIGPVDLVRPDKADAFIPREMLFTRREWIDDPAFTKLVQRQISPLGGVQFYSEEGSRILISWNRPEDLKDLAIKNGRLFYHQWGSDWHYGRDQMARHWMYSLTGGSLFVSNVSERQENGAVFIKLFSPDQCHLKMLGADSSEKALHEMDMPPGQLRELAVTNLLFKPGMNTISLRAVRTAGEPGAAALYIHGIRVE